MGAEWRVGEELEGRGEEEGALRGREGGEKGGKIGKDVSGTYVGATLNDTSDTDDDSLIDHCIVPVPTGYYRTQIARQMQIGEKLIEPQLVVFPL